MTSNENILDLIKHMKTFIETNEDSIDYTIFYNMNKEMIDDYVIYSNILNESEIKFLFSLVKNNIKINDNLIVNIFKFSNKKVEVPIIVSAVKTADVENVSEKKNSMINYYKLLDKIFIIKAHPKFIFLLWNSKNDKNINLDEISYNIKSSITKTRDNINYKIIKIDYDILFNYFNENEDRFLFQKNFINFKNLNRVFGVPLSSSNYKLNYTIEFVIDDNNCLIYNIYDTISTKYIDLYTKNYQEKIYFNNESDLIDKTIDNVIQYLHKYEKTKVYFSLFLSNNLLSRYISKLFVNDNIITYNDLKIDKNIYIYEQEEKKIQNFTCIHDEDYKKIFEDINNYYDNFNKFLEKYIIIDNNLSLCNVCGENLEIFNFVDQVFLEKNGEVIITNNKINIFEYATYNTFIDANNYLTNIMIIFDNLFNTSQMTEFNNNCRLILDFLISINTNRLNYENTYKDDIRNSYLFIIRLNNKIFSLQYNIQELYGEEIYLNLNIIICITLILTCTFNNLFSIMKKYKLISIFEKYSESNGNNYNSEGIFIILMTKIVTKFLNRLKIKDTIDQLKLEKTIIVYLKILTIELKSYYNIIVKRYYTNFLKLIKTKNEIQSSDLVPGKYCIKNNLTSLTNINKYRNIYSNVYVNIESPIYTVERDNFNIDIGNIMIYKNFNDIAMSMQLKKLIDKISYTIEYNKNSIISYEISNNNIIKLNISKNKTIELYMTHDIFFNNMFDFVGNEYFYFFNNSILLPILDHYNIQEFVYIMENFNSLLNIIYDNRYFLIDISKIFENNLNINKNYIYHLLYNILYIEYQITDIDNWIIEYKDIIKNHYNNIRNNY
jgi:hypothetical protein